MDISLFDFDLPIELIAQTPAEKRDESRLLLIDKDNKTYEDKIFHDIIDYLRPGDVLVRNNTKVLPARIFGIKEDTGAHVEILLLHQIKGDIWECLAGNARPIKVGSVISFKDGKLKGLSFGDIYFLAMNRIFGEFSKSVESSNCKRIEPY